MNKDVILANGKVVVQELMSEPDPLPLISACAVAGNGWQENFLQPVTRGPKDHGSDGFLQWRLDRLTALQQLPNWDTLPVQARYFKSECRAKYPTLWGQLTNPRDRTIENLTANICDIYERPSAAGRVLDKRIGYAKQMFKLYDTLPPKSEPVTTPATDPVSTLIGLLAWALSYLVYHGIGTATLGSWLPWAAIGAVLIFMIDTRSLESPVIPAQESDMDPTVILKILGVLETLAPVVEKLATDAPNIIERIGQIEQIVQALQAPDANAASRAEAIAARISNIGAPK